MEKPKSPTLPPRPPASWVPTLYFAEGLPFCTILLVATIMYKRMGVANDVIALYTSWLLLPWTLKPLWSPLLEMFKTKKFFVVLLQFLGGLCLGLIALSLPMPHYFRYSLVLFGFIALFSSTHDIAADGLYIASLSSKQQAAYAGWQGAFYNVAKAVAQGGLVILAGVLESHMAVARAWSVIFFAMGLVMVLLSLYHSWILPHGGSERTTQSLRQARDTFVDVVKSFVQKPHILLLLLFIFLYRAGEGQIAKIGPLFLVDGRDVGGLGLTTEQYGMAYGVIGLIAFIIGSVLGGYFTSWLGLKRALLPLICIMNLPNLAYVYLSTALPDSLVITTSAISIEMFGYGFGFVGVIILMMQQIAPGRYQTAHYAFGTALMNLGLLLPGSVSGMIQMTFGYQKFFIGALISAIPALVLARFLPLRSQDELAQAGESTTEQVA